MCSWSGLSIRLKVGTAGGSLARFSASPSLTPTLLALHSTLTLTLSDSCGKVCDGTVWLDCRRCLLREAGCRIVAHPRRGVVHRAEAVRGPGMAWHGQDLHRHDLILAPSSPPVKVTSAAPAWSGCRSSLRLQSGLAWPGLAWPTDLQCHILRCLSVHRWR